MKLLLFALLLSPRPADLPGWGKTRWGMTAVETLGALEGDGNWCQHDNARVCIAATRIGGFDYKAELIPDDQGKLRGVVLRPHEIETPGLPAAMRMQSPAESFPELARLLTSKYGPPDNKSDAEQSEIVTSIVTWAFPSTTIELRRIWHRRIAINGVTLHYAKPGKIATDKL